MVHDGYFIPLNITGEIGEIRFTRKNVDMLSDVKYEFTEFVY